MEGFNEAHDAICAVAKTDSEHKLCLAVTYAIGVYVNEN